MSNQTTAVKTREEIEAIAMEFQTEANKIKLLEQKQEEKKLELIQFVDAHPELMTDSKFRFECGVLVSKSLTEKLKWQVGGEKQKMLEQSLLQKLGVEYKTIKLNDTLIISNSKTDTKLKKILDDFKVGVTDAISWVVRK